MKHLLLVHLFLFFFTSISFSQVLVPACLPITDQNTDFLYEQHFYPKQRLIHINPMSYFEFLRLKNSPELITSISKKQARLDRPFLFEIPVSKRRIHLDITDYDWLRINRDSSLRCNYFSTLPAYPFCTFCHTPKEVSLEPIFYNAKSISYNFSIPRTIPQSVSVFSTSCRVKMVMMSRSFDCLKMAGILGTSHCPVTFTFELLNQEDIEKFGQFYTLNVTESEADNYKNRMYLVLKKSKFGFVSAVL